MWRFAAALPLTNRTGRFFRDERRALDELERRRLPVFRVRRAEEPVPLFFRRLRPPADERLERGTPPDHARGLKYIEVTHLRRPHRAGSLQR